MLAQAVNINWIFHNLISGRFKWFHHETLLRYVDIMRIYWSRPECGLDHESRHRELNVTWLTDWHLREVSSENEGSMIYDVMYDMFSVKTEILCEIPEILRKKTVRDNLTSMTMTQRSNHPWGSVTRLSSPSFADLNQRRHRKHSQLVYSEYLKYSVLTSYNCLENYYLKRCYYFQR